MTTDTTMPSTGGRWNAFINPPADGTRTVALAIHVCVAILMLCSVGGFLSVVFVGDTILGAGFVTGVFLMGALLPLAVVLVVLRRDVLTTLAFVMTSSAAWTAWSIAGNTIG